jgi:hypothetical protein
LVFLVVSFLLAFPPISCMHSSSPHSCFMPCPSHPPCLDHSNVCLARSTSYEAPHYAISSNLPSLHLSSVQIFFSARRSQTPSVCVPPLMLETNIYIYI